MTNRPVFPCRSAPDDPSEARLLGIYPQRQDGLFMQRVRIPGGRIDAGPLRALAAIADRETPGYPLHLTTRQDVELHGLSASQIPAVQARLAAEGLSGLGACGDCPRNVTMCPGAGRCEGSWDVGPVAEAIRSVVEAPEWLCRLPRKFKVSVSGCSRACAKPWINDVGLIAVGEDHFEAMVAGSLGAKPGAGVRFPAAVGVAEVPAFVTAALRLFDDEGDRENRARARLRHVRQRVGDGAFLGELGERFAAERVAASVPPPRLVRCVDGWVACRVQLPRGDIGPAQAAELAGAADAAAAELRIGFEHDLFVYADRESALPTSLAGLQDGPCVVACPGTTWCKRGVADARGAADAIRAALPAGCGLSICISGCPNNCAQSGVAHIGLVGRIQTVRRERREAFGVSAGGELGRGPRLGVGLHPAVPAQGIGGMVAELAAAYPLKADAAAIGAFCAAQRSRLAETLTEEPGR